MTIKQMLELLWARRRLFGMVFGGIVLLALVVSLIWPKTYVAEVSIVIDSKSTDPVSGNEQASELMPSNIATQADVIASHNVALKVVEKLRLAADPDLQERFRQATGGAGSIQDWIADSLLRYMEIKPSRESHVINIDVGSANPQAAAAIANAFAEGYIQTSLELKMEPARRQTAWFQEQLLGLRKSLETAQARLSEYQRTHNVEGTNEQIDIENARLAEISSQLITAQATMYEGKTRLKQVNQASKRDELQAEPDILANPVLQNMKADLARAEGRLADVGQHFGHNHPQYLSAAAEVKSLQEKLTTEINTTKGAIGQSAQQSTAQVAELRRALDQQRDRILDLKRQHDDLDVLRREVDSAQRVYDAGLQRATQVRLESQLDQSNIAVLNAAVPPLRPERPKTILNLLIAIVFGAVVGAAAAIAAELSDRRVRTTADFTTSTGVIVLAEVPRPLRIKRRRRFLGGIPKMLVLKPQ